MMETAENRFYEGDPTQSLLRFPLPLLASTHFCMEVLLRGSVLDLRSVVEILTCDPCAVLRLFFHSSVDCPALDGEVMQLEQRTIAIGVPGLKRALYYVPSSWQQQAALSSFAEHGAAIGRRCQTVAAALGACEQTAYLVGLLHDLGALPAQLNGRSSPAVPERIHLAGALCHAYQLPGSLQQAIMSVHAEPATGLWGAVVQAAHELLSTSENATNSRVSCITN